MDFSLSEELLTLRRSANDFLANEVNLAPLLKPGATVEQAGYDSLWPKLVELGWPAMIVPEAHGGLGMSLLELSMIITECGRFLAAAPLFGTLAGAWAIEAAGSAEQKSRWLPKVASGSLRLALAVPELDEVCDLAQDDLEVVRTGHGSRLSGVREFVVDAGAADKVVVLAASARGQQCWLVDRNAKGVTIDILDWRDITRQVCRVGFDDVQAEPLEAGPPNLWARLRDRLLLVLAAESAGGLQGVLESTVSYAKERVAFGRPIGAYQSIKHSLADMLVQAECTATAVLYAAWALSEEDESATLATAMAQSQASEAFRDASFRSIQIFGAIGFTWEMKNHLYYKRARANTELLGAPSRHRERIMRILEARHVEKRGKAGR